MEEEKRKTNKVELVQVPTNHELAFKTPEGDVLSHEEYLVWMGNLLWDTKRNIG